MKPLTVEELCRKLKPIFGRKIDLLYLKYALADSKEKKAEIEQALTALFHKHLNKSMFSEKVLLEPPAADSVKGEYPLGKVIYADKEVCLFGLREQDWQRHICISGMSGSGKTTFAYQIIGNFILKKKPFIVFDWKRSFRPLLKVDPDALLFTIGNENVANYFKININEPPKGVHPKEWLTILCDIITETFFASYGVHKILLETLDKAFKDFGVYGGSGNYPTWYQIKDRLEEREAEFTKKTGRESEWLTSALRIAHALTFGGFGEALNYKGEYSMKVQDLFDKKVVFELDSLNNAEKRFFCQFLLTYIYKYKKANLQDSREFRNAIIIDEAHNIFLKERPIFLNESITDVIYREIREYGISLICLDQHISKLSDVVAGNSACNIAFQQVLPEDVEKVSGIMQLKDRKKFFSMLPVGYAIVKLAERHHDPFLIKAPFIDIKKHIISDGYIKDRMREYVKYEKTIRIFRESCMPDKLQAKIANTDLLMKATGVDTGIKEAELEGLRKERPKGMYNWNKIIVNHIQEFLFDYAFKQLKAGFSKEQIIKRLALEGYNRQDIDIAITNAVRKYEKILKEKNITPKNLMQQKAVEGVKGINAEHIEALKIIQSNPGIATSSLYKMLGLSGRKGNSLKNELYQLGFISIIENKNERGWVKRIKITEKGSSLIAHKGFCII
ncbi:MAG: DUF87 domain-containing protein [Candidatus Woesearchaeota archaeon]|nr:DUF87 domain-containing protein [Candidatus Woesearchaeota archaeon]